MSPQRRLAALVIAILLLLAGTTMPGSLKADIEGQLWRAWPWSASAHFVLFGVIAAIQIYGEGRWALARALVLGVGLAVLTEQLQQFVPGRHPLLRDGLIDLAGTVTGVLAARMLARQPTPAKT
jgi:VanZ family protein